MSRLRSLTFALSLFLSLIASTTTPRIAEANIMVAIRRPARRAPPVGHARINSVLPATPALA